LGPLAQASAQKGFLMNRLLLPALTAGIFFCSCVIVLAQETPPPSTLPPPKPVPQETTLPTPTALPVAPDCHHGNPALNILPVEQVHPVHIIEVEEDIGEVRRPGLAIDYKIEKQEIINYVLEKKEVVHLVPCTKMVPCTETDPHTGHCTTVMKEVTEMQPQKDFVFVSVPKTEYLEIKIPYLKEVEEVIPRRTIILRNTTVLQTDIAVVPAPTVVYPDQYLLIPPGCAAPTHLP
jgi:hypothetical protein